MYGVSLNQLYWSYFRRFFTLFLFRRPCAVCASSFSCNYYKQMLCCPFFCCSRTARKKQSEFPLSLAALLCIFPPKKFHPNWAAPNEHGRALVCFYRSCLWACKVQEWMNDNGQSHTHAPNWQNCWFKQRPSDNTFTYRRLCNKKWYRGLCEQERATPCERPKLKPQQAANKVHRNGCGRREVAARVSHFQNDR